MLFPSALSKTLAAFVAAGALTVGVGSSAYATTTTVQTPTSGVTTPDKGCAHVDKKLDRLAKGRHTLEARLDHEQKALDAARDHHRTDRAARIEHRIDRTKKARDRVVDRITKLSARCHVTVPVAPPAPSIVPTTPAPPAT